MQAPVLHIQILHAHLLIAYLTRLNTIHQSSPLSSMGCFPVPHTSPDTKPNNRSSSLSHSSPSQSPKADPDVIPSSPAATSPHQLCRSKSTHNHNAGSIASRRSCTGIAYQQHHQQNGIDLGCSAPRFRALAFHTLKHSHKTVTASQSLRRVSSYHKPHVKQSRAPHPDLSSSSTLTAYGHGQESRVIFHSAPLCAESQDREPKPSNRVFFPLPLPPSPASQAADDRSSQFLSSTTTSTSISSCSSSSSVHNSSPYKTTDYQATLTSHSLGSETPNRQPNPQPLPLPLPPDIVHLREFTFDELAGACQNFVTEFYIRNGGIGPVYRAMLSRDLQGEGPLEVAVTKLSGYHSQSFKKWRGQVEFVACLSHPNLCRLLGFTGEDPSTTLDHNGAGLQKEYRYCGHRRGRLLVFEHTSNGSLDSLLYCRDGRAPLDWAKRLKIAAGAAQGLAFLHERIPKQIIYKVFKTSNIQVDESFNAKLSDYGFTAGCCNEISSSIDTLVAEDAYTAPESMVSPSRHRESSAKSHVWSFGVVLLELLTGRLNKDSLFPQEERNLVEWCRPYLLDSKKLYLVMDPELKGRYPTRAAKTVADLALLCLADDPTARPSMKNVADVLSSQIKPHVTSQTIDSKARQYTATFSGSAVGDFEHHIHERSAIRERETLELSKSHGLARSMMSPQGYGRWRGSASTRQKSENSRALLERFLWSGDQAMAKGLEAERHRQVFLSGEATG